MRHAYVLEIKSLVLKVLSSPELDLSDFVVEDSGQIAEGKKSIFGFIKK